MGFGLISWAAAKGLEGGGKEGVDVAKSAAEHYRLQDHEKFKSDLAIQRETALEKLRQEGADRRLGVTETGADRRLGAQLNLTRSENLLMRTFQASEHKLDRESRERQHTESMAVQRAHVGIAQQQLKLAQEKITLVPQADGTLQKMTADGRPAGTLTDLSGNPIQGPKDVAATTKYMIETYQKALAAVERDIQSETDPAARQALREKRDNYVRMTETLLGFAESKPSTPGGRPPLSSFGGGSDTKPRPAAPASATASKSGDPDAGDISTGRAPATSSAPTPQNLRLEAKFQSETAELESGRRTAYSPDVMDYLNQMKDERRRGNQGLIERERERALRESRVIANQPR